MSTFKSTLILQLSVVEALSITEAPAGTSPTLQHQAFNRTIAANGTTPYPETAHVAISGALTAGAFVLDLTAAPKTGGGTQDLTGLKLRKLLFRVPAAQHAMTLGPDPTSGYAPFGAAVSPSVPTDGDLLVHFADGLAAIDATHKRLKIAGTGTDTFQLQMLFG